MPKNSFVMHVQKQGRMKYLFITMVPPIILLYLLSLFSQTTLQLDNTLFSHVCISISLASMAILANYFIFRKNHRIEVNDNQITEYNWRQIEARKIKISQINSYKRNWLHEIILFDNSGNKLLCIESNMSNFQRFEQWLERHNIH